MQFDAPRAIYIGYQKILGMSDSKSLKGNGRRVAAGFKFPAMEVNAAYETQRNQLSVDPSSIASVHDAAQELIYDTLMTIGLREGVARSIVTPRPQRGVVFADPAEAPDCKVVCIRLNRRLFLQSGSTTRKPL